jgi:phosphoenolpyruvate---glycerone phosphotransferase subunit DhaL
LNCLKTGGQIRRTGQIYDSACLQLIQEKMQKLTIGDFISMWKCALAKVSERADEFSRLDAATGDGDHGTAIVQALSSSVEAAEKGTEFKTMLSEMGFNVMMQTGGSTSTLFGAFLLGMSDHAEGTELDGAQVINMFHGGLAGVQKQTKAVRGDKTMMDALIPAIDAMQSAGSTDMRELFAAAAEAAQKGALATIDMKANFGRARNYGERSIGTADAGASSWACMFSAFHESVAG